MEKKNPEASKNAPKAANDMLGEDSSLIEIQVTTRLEVPKGATVSIAANGNTNGIKLPCGQVIKPWIAFEKNEEEDLTYEELENLGCSYDAVERDITKIK